MEKKILKIDGMSCAHCVKAVNDSLSEVPGVQGVNVSLENATAEVTYDEVATDMEAMQTAVIDAGYTVL